jgi:4-amino-4-deoxy-L-arabinose transferase-like glycosyltransferase
MKKTLKYYDIFSLLLIIIAFVIYKFSDLYLPYYWDEAWSYKPAVENMYKTGLSLFPNAISSETYKGHPLFFYFISSLWLNIFGNTVFSSKLFALSVSVLLMITTFLFTKFLTKDKILAILSTLLLSVQAIFIAQSTLLLPEMLLTVLSLSTWLFYFKNQKLLYILTASLSLLTKETAIVLIVSIFISEITFNFKSLKTDFKKYLEEKYYLIIPIIPIVVFFIIQKINSGWIFYPEHINLMEFGQAFFDKLETYFGLLVIYQGRNFIFLLALLELFFIIIQKIKIDKKKEIISLSIFIILYIIFSSLNFFSPRYIISVIPVFIILIVYLINIAIKNKKISYALLIALSISPLYYNYTHFQDFDHCIGYVNVIDVQKKMTNYCEENNFYDKEIATHFLMKVNLTDSIMGYLSSSKTFTHTNTNINENTQYILVSSNEQNEGINSVLQNYNLELVQEYYTKQAWCRLFIIK